jgi:hypothetical protein
MKLKICNNLLSSYSLARVSFFISKYFLVLAMLTLPFALLARAEETPEDHQVYLYLQLHGEDDIAFPDSDRLFLESYRDFKNAYPDRKVKKVTAESAVDLKNQLDHLLEPEEKISHLFISSHGTSGLDKSAYFSVLQVGESDLIGFVYPRFSQEAPGAEKEKMKELNLNSSSIFSGIHGRFTRDSKVVADACHILSGDERTAKYYASGIQYVLGQDQGSMYGNRVEGNSYTSGEKKRIVNSRFLGTLGSAFTYLGLGYFPRVSGRPWLRFAASAGSGMYCGAESVAKAVNPYVDWNNRGYQVYLKGDGVSRITPYRYAHAKEEFFSASVPAAIPQPTSALQLPHQQSLFDAMDSFNY